MGLTEKGYTRRTYVDILAEKERRAKELLGEDIDTSDQSVLGKYLRVNAYDQAIAEEEIEQVYYSRFPNTASGQSLDRLMVFAGISRNPASAAEYRVRFTGTAGYVIPVGFLVATDTDVTYWTIQDYTIGTDGTVLADVCCSEVGTVGNLASAAAISRIVNPDANVDAVAGVEIVNAGVDEESDTELRKRFAAAISGAGSGNTNAIRAALLRIPGVKFAAVVENETDEEDSEGRPAHSFECYVQGGEGSEQEIAQAIFDKRPVGIQTWGDEAVTITDLSGNERVVKYTYAPEVSVIVSITVRTSTSFPDDGKNRITTAVSNYINNLGIGNSLVLSTLYGYIYSVPGVTEVTSLKLSADGGAYSADNITVPQYGTVVCAGVALEVVT